MSFVPYRGFSFTDDRSRTSALRRCATALVLASLLVLLLQREVRAAEENESATRLIGTVKVLASDEMEGRGVGTQGIDAAANYIAEQFREMGLKTDLYDGQPFQTFTIAGVSELGPVAENHLSIEGPENKGDRYATQWKVGEDYNPLAAGGTGTAAGELVFVGYGITAPDRKYDDYAGVDVKGKVVLMLRKEPQQGDRESVFDGTRSTSHATFRSKITNAQKHGAVAIIMVNDAYAVQRRGQRLDRDWRGAVETLTHKVEQFSKQAELSADDVKKAQGELSKLAADVAAARSAAESNLDELPGVTAAGLASGDTIPVFFCRREAVDPIVKRARHGPGYVGAAHRRGPDPPEPSSGRLAG